jgi:asparagine synthase (glutamine-hydrolysing)
MCGIAGLLHADPTRPAEPELVRRMTATLVHRGPDGDGFLVAGPVGLGMRRLAIIDLEGGDQPLYNEDRSVAVVQNGEIYNYIELKRELESLGHCFRTRSDTEVLVHAYETWGVECVQHLNGMWAFALWDARCGRLLLARDRLGIKPLHYTWDGRTLLFGSEIKALLEGGWPAEPHWEVLDAYVAFGFVPEPYSLVRGVHKLPAGCTLVLEGNGSPRLRRYWQPPIVDESDARRDEKRIVEEFTALLSDAVRLQLRSDVPLGAFLSGGLDSGSIVLLGSEILARESAGPMQTFTVGFEAAGYDERALARSVAKRAGSRHHERVVSFADLEGTLDLLGKHFDEPFGDSSAIAAYAIAGVARERVTVALSGDGGDEVLAGYTRYQGEKFSAAWAGFPGLLRRQLVPGCVNAARSLTRGRLRDRLDRTSRVLEAANLSFVERVSRKQSWSSPALRERMWHAPNSNLRPAREFVEEAMRDCPARDNFHRLNWFDLKMMLPSEMLTKVDRTSMAQSLEVRVPFLDHRLVEMMAPVSTQVKLPGYRRKHVLRRAMASRLPSEVLRAPKRGFNVPVREWFRQDAPVKLLEKRLAQGILDDLVDRQALRNALEMHRRGDADHGMHLWILLQLATWCERLGRVTQRA